MVKEIFYKIITDDQQRTEFFYLDNQEDIYEFFCQKGYRDDFETFKEDMREFLNSSEAHKIMHNFGDFTLSEDMLNMVAGGQNVRKPLTDGIDLCRKVFMELS